MHIRLGLLALCLLAWFATVPASAQQVHVFCSVDGTNGLSSWVPCPAGSTASGAISQQVSSVPAVGNTSHTSGLCVGPTTATTVASNNGQSGYVFNFVVGASSAVTPSLIVYLFHTNPSGSTCADGGTFALAQADQAKLIGAPQTITLAAPNGVGTPTFGEVTYTPPRPFLAGGATTSGVKTIYYQIVTSSTFTPAANGITVDIGVGLN